MAPFLALYLLVMVFFIVLVSISSVERIKSEKVMDSVSSAFSPTSPAGAVPTAFPENQGKPTAGYLFQRQLADLFTQQLRIVDIRVVKPGSLMQVVLPADSLFHTDSADIRKFRDLLLDRIVAEISRRPPGLHFGMEFEIGSPSTAGNILPATATLEIKRAGTFAREMLARGAPPDAISVAIRPGDPRNIKLTFLVRGIERTRPDLGGPGA
jgi:hypothetical protein